MAEYGHDPRSLNGVSVPKSRKINIFHDFVIFVVFRDLSGTLQPPLGLAPPNKNLMIFSSYTYQIVLKRSQSTQLVSQSMWQTMSTIRAV